MHPLLIPLALLFLAITRKAFAPAAAPAQAPKPTPPPGGTIDRGVLRDALVSKLRARAAQPLAAHPNVIPAAAEQQAAVDAAVSHAIREETAPPAAPAADESKTKAAQSLLMFLIKTGRFGGGKDRPPEVKAAQQALGVKPDGIVGPKTRTAALNQGVALPPKPKE
jgi:hypothetical protein